MKILSWLQQIHHKRQQEKSRRLYIEGFDYSIGALVRREKTPMELDIESDSIYRNSFDLGIDAAIVQAIKLGITVDNRI